MYIDQKGESREDSAIQYIRHKRKRRERIKLKAKIIIGKDETHTCMKKEQNNEWTGSLVTPAHYLCTGASRDPPKSASHAVELICRKHGKLQHFRNGF